MDNGLYSDELTTDEREGLGPLRCGTPSSGRKREMRGAEQVDRDRRDAIA